jgi:hypothetical protein
MANQINPLLIEALTGQIQENENPTISMVMGTYVKKVARQRDKIKAILPENKQKLECLSCKRKGIYNVGQVIIDPEKYSRNSDSIKDFQATGYFRCKHCNKAGHWKTSSEFTLMMTASLLKLLVSRDSGLVEFGRAQLFDGSSHKWSTDSEDYLLSKIMENNREAALLWNKLGNLYYKGNHPELAVAAFERSVLLDDGFLESHYSLGDVLCQVGEIDKAIFHYRKVLVSSHAYEKIEPFKVRELTASSLQDLFYMQEDASVFLSTLPTRDDLINPDGKVEKENSVRSYIDLDFEIFPDELVSFYPLAEMYMGKIAKQLPLNQRTLEQLTKGSQKLSGVKGKLKSMKKKEKNKKKMAKQSRRR